jgi:UPF0271 protein
MQIDPAELASIVIYQLGALAGIARSVGHRMTHMSFHGALGNMAAADPVLAAPLLAAVAAFDPTLVVLTSASRAIQDAAAAVGLRAAVCFLADRAYDDSGLLVPRKLPNSIITDHDAVMARVRHLLTEGAVVTHSGKSLPMEVTSILLHGDTPGAVSLARTIRGVIEAAGAQIVPLSRQRAR